MTKLKTFGRYTGGLILAVIVTAFLASIISTQRVIGGLTELGTDVSFGDRVSMTGYDAIHFGTLYGIFIFIALTAAFAAGGLVFRLAKFGRLIVYCVAGAVAMLVMLLAMQEVFFGVPIVGGARDEFGLALQMVAGGIGGAVYAAMTKRKSPAY